ncbi:Flp pilus assembly protein CpaB [Nocardioides seonyuensis]|uniref:Flp pilus assembly protein CpaB n=1 Tax=Nocardioides seonyuensis TaxID=2518371 RepID=A0A4P7IEI2_9ACTN|nr:Flp pilus assembly protein CpaB [Nocardioides seonyuensis]QBX54081.1 Flp pilus assembly protein CpaB [Nocardioides seonyuensis]
MARRSVLLLVAVLIALLGTAMIVMYVQGIDDRATEGQELVEVLTATEVIDTGETVSAAQEAGKFEKSEVRRDDMVDGALSSTSSISDLVALGTIYPGEQLIAKKFGNLGDAQNLVIPDGLIAVSVELTDWERVAGFVNPGSEVAVFVTAANPVRITPAGDEIKLAGVTRIVLPRSQVIGVGTTSVTSRTVTTGDGDEVTEEVPKTILTLAVTQNEAEKLIHSDRVADLTFALLTEDSKTKDEPGSTLNDVIPETYRIAP